MAEHSLPFTLAPVLTDLTKTLAEDPKALAHLSMDRTTASYKMTYGVAETFKERIVRNMRQTPFSLNIDESTSSNDKRVLAVLVSFYNKVSSSVVCEHMESVELIKINAESICNVIVDLIETNDIPWSNLTSVLMDSCSVITVLIVHRIVLFGPGSLLPRWRTEKQPRGRCQLFIIYKCYSELFTCIDRTCERNIDFLN